MDIKPAQYHDFTSLAALRKTAADSPDQAIAPVAKQFEALFVQMMLKSMRDAVPEGGLFDSDSMKFYQQMMDSQLSVSLSEQGGLGLADTITQQLSQASGSENATTEATRLQLRMQQRDSLWSGAAQDATAVADTSVTDSSND